jgi:anti-anti-sigma factor
MQRGSTNVTTTSPPELSWDATVIRAELSPALSVGLPVSVRFARSGARSGLAVRTEERDGAAWLFLSGEMDLATAPLVEENLAAAQRGRNAVYVDLEDLTFMDVSGLAIFLNGAKRAGDSGGRFGVVNIQAPVRRVFEVTRSTFLLGSETSTPGGAQQCGELKEHIDYLTVPH